MVSHGVERKLLLVSAPAGYGKTTAVREALLQLQTASIWFAAVTKDGQQHFEFRPSSSYQDDVTSPWLTSGLSVSRFDVLDADQLLRKIEVHIRSNTDTDQAIVLDGCDWLNEDAVTIEKLDRLILSSPAHAHFILIGRCVPALKCSCYLALGRQLAVIGSSDLQSSYSESRAILRLTHGRRISPSDLDRIVHISEGWIAAMIICGVQLVSLNSQDIGPSDVQLDLLYDYLHSEVFCRQSPSVRRFLLATSIVDEFCPSLCDSILSSSDSEAIIQYLRDHSVFIERAESNSDNYRYHGLFLRYLRKQVKSSVGDRSDVELHTTSLDLRSLHLRASEWYRRQGDVSRHIHHIMASGDGMTAAKHIVDMLEFLYVDGGYADFISLVSDLPETVVQHYPIILHRLAGAHMMTGDMNQALREFTRAIEQLESTGDNETLSKALIGRSEPLQLIGEVNAAVNDLHRAMTLTGDTLTRARAKRLLGQCMISSNDFEQALLYLDQSLEDTITIQAHRQTAIVHSDLSMLHHLQGRFDEATEHAISSMRIWRDTGDIGNYALALNNLGTAHHAQGNLEVAEHLIRESCSLAQSAGVWRYYTLSLMSLADVLSDRGNLVEACLTYESSVDLLRHQKLTSLTVYGMAMWADVKRLRRDLVGANRLLIDAQSLAPSNVDKFIQHLIEYSQGVIALDDLDYATSARYVEKSAEGFISLGRLREAVRSALYGVVVAHLTSDQKSTRRWIDVVNACSSRKGALLALEVDLPRAQKYLDGDHGKARISLRDMLCASSTDYAARDHLSGHRGLRSSTNHATVSMLALGVPRVTRGGASIDGEFQTRPARDMLFYLIESRNGRSQDELMSVFWPHSTSRRARSAMQTTLSRIRKVIGTKSLVLDGDRYYIARDSGITFDVDDFLGLVAQAESSDSPSQAIELLQAALMLIRGEYMEGIYSDWVIALRWKYERLITRTLKMLADYQVESQYWEDAIQSLLQIIDQEPTMESAYRRLMRAYVTTGDRASALVVYSRLVDTLKQDLGVEPDPRSRALHQVIRERGDIS